MPLKVRRRSAESLPAHDSGFVTGRLSSWKLTSPVIDAFVSDIRTSNLLVMCLEPGMGQGAALKVMLSDMKQHSATHIFRFSGIEADAASKRLSRFARQVEKECLAGKGVFVALDSVPAGDDVVIDREIAAISRMTGSGAIVAVSLLPEDALLAERLTDSVCVSPKDLLVSDVLDLRPSDPLYDVRTATGGIPSLVGAIIRDNGSLRSDSILFGNSYYSALEQLVNSSLRSNLLDEELLVRLSMILLGRGTFEDIASVVCVEPSDVARGLEEFAPLFGVSCRDHSFCCFGVDTIDGISACSSVLSTRASLWSSVFDSVLRVFVERGEFKRAATIARMAPSKAVASVLLEHAEDFIGVGEAGLVRRTLGPALAHSQISDDRSRCLDHVLAALGDTKFRTPGARAPQSSADGSDLGGANQADALLVGCRAVLAGEAIPTSAPDIAWVAGIAVHLQAVQLLRDGRIRAAQGLAGSHALSCTEGTLPAALLHLDLGIASALLGDDQTSVDGSISRAQDFLAQEGYAAIRDEASLLLAFDAILHGSCDLASMDALVRESERTGNELVRVAALMTGAAAEYMMGDFRSAGLRSAIAASAAARAGFSHLEAEAGILCKAATGPGLGIGAVPPDWEDACDTEELSAVARLVHAALAGDDLSPDIRLTLGDAPIPSDEVWLLKVLTSGQGDIQERVRKLIPHAWTAALAPIAFVQRAPQVIRTSEAGGGNKGDGDARGVAPGARLRLSLLGGFSLQVDGETVPEWRLDRRCAKAMLVFVALHPNLLARRYEIIDQVWPDCDYKAGLDRIYQATSALRRVIAEVTPDLDPFLSYREDKSVSFDPALFACDFEEFADAAKEALTCEGDDARSLDAALRAERLYVGDLFVPSRDFTGYVVARRQELRELYADSMVAGAEAAFRLGRYRISARLADSATDVDDLREDAVEVLIRALRASGRMFEAEQRYKKYAVHFVDRTHMPPSKRLRKAMGEGGRGEGDKQHRQNDGEPMAS